MLVAEVVSFRDDFYSGEDNNDNNSTLLQDISFDSPYVDEDYTSFYFLAKSSQVIIIVLLQSHN